MISSVPLTKPSAVGCVASKSMLNDSEFRFHQLKGKNRRLDSQMRKLPDKHVHRRGSQLSLTRKVWIVDGELVVMARLWCKLAQCRGKQIAQHEQLVELSFIILGTFSLRIMVVIYFFFLTSTKFALIKITNYGKNIQKISGN